VHRSSLFARTCFALILLALTVSSAIAHPLSQGVLDVVVNPDKITVRARVTTEEVQITNSSTAENPLPAPWAATGAEAFERHADYLAAHLHFIVDGKPLTGRVLTVSQPEDTSNLKTSSAVYTLEYPLRSPSPRIIQIRQDALVDAHFSAGQSWETIYFVTISQPDCPVTQGLLSRNDQISFITANPTGEQATATTRAHLFGAYCIHGINHILGQPVAGSLRRTGIGFDHLLFVTALVLSTKSLWDLIKVVSAFTLAHTITLSLAALKLVHVPEAVSEPLISLSIVFVAVQNVFWPDQSRGALRLAAAFFFGLFHGLGFAGGLLETMQEMHGSTIFLAILAFSLGVELGHQIVVLPLFAILTLVRKSRPTEPAQERLHFNVQRFGSAAISLAGLFYLVVALRLSFAGSAPP
jgi:hypothetical protein